MLLSLILIFVKNFP